MTSIRPRLPTKKTKKESAKWENIFLKGRDVILSNNSLILLTIPLILSAYTHLWNPVGFPTFHVDEGHYLRKAMYILEGKGLQESPEDVLSHYNRIYTHPYFGQTFLAGVLKIVGYPDSLHYTAGDIHSIENLWLVPRVLMGLLAIVDTFLIYKIAERRYNRNIATIASILFAIMPISWITRMVLLDSILLPFLLSSILFAGYLKGSKYSHNSNKKIAIIFLSGIFLGLAIFTKIPAFTVIPFVGALIYTNSNSHKLRNLGLWFIPVISIPLIWPGYSLAAGQYEQWLDGVLWQAGRGGGESFNGLSKATYNLFKMDPVFIVLGFGGLIFAALKRDFYPLLWAVPFIVFMYLIGYVSYWFLIPLLLPLCIAAATMIVGVSSRIFEKKPVHRILPFAIIFGIGIFGLINTSMLITLNMNLIYFQVQSTLTQYLASLHNTDDDDDKKKKVFIMARPTYLWILKYAFDEGHHHDYQSYYNLKKIHRTISQGKYDKFIFVVDGRFKADLSKITTKQHLKEIQTLYNNLPTLAKINMKNTNSYDANQYPYNTNLKMMGKGWGRVEIRASY
jgi:hypothetical protein